MYDLAPLSQLSSLTAMTLRLCFITDGVLATFPPLPSLRTLDLMDNPLRTLDPLAALTNLTALAIGGNEFEPPSLRPLEKLARLERLAISAVPKELMQSLAALPVLTHLCVVSRGWIPVEIDMHAHRTLKTLVVVRDVDDVKL